MTQEQLIKFLIRVHAWIPHDNPMRKELREKVVELGGRIPEPVVFSQQEVDTTA
jgi:hypothetical protein